MKEQGGRHRAQTVTDIETSEHKEVETEFETHGHTEANTKMKTQSYGNITKSMTDKHGDS